LSATVIVDWHVGVPRKRKLRGVPTALSSQATYFGAAMKSKERRNLKNRAKAPPRQAPGTGSWKRRLLLTLTVLLAAGGTWALFEFVIWSRVPSELVGKWVVVGGPQDGATFDFFRNGTMEGNVNFRETNKPFFAVVRVDGKNIYTTTKHPETGQDDTQVKVIRTLTATNLVIEDEQGKLTQLERAE
jgi:hypothetical protein